MTSATYSLPRPPKVRLIRVFRSSFGGTWGLLEDSWVVLVIVFVWAQYAILLTGLKAMCFIPPMYC